MYHIVHSSGRDQKHIGHWHHGIKHGRCKTFFPSGVTFEGTYYAGKLEGPGVYHFNGNNDIEGTWINNLMPGHF